MASTSRYGGPSYTPEELADPDLPAVIVKRAEIGYVDQAPKEESSLETDGTGSSQSSTRDQKPSGSPETADPKPARTTVNRSKARKTEQDSSAHSTGGSGQQTEKESPDDGFDEFDEFA